MWFPFALAIHPMNSNLHLTLTLALWSQHNTTLNTSKYLVNGHHKFKAIWAWNTKALLCLIVTTLKSLSPLKTTCSIHDDGRLIPFTEHRGHRVDLSNIFGIVSAHSRIRLMWSCEKCKCFNRSTKIYFHVLYLGGSSITATLQ